MKFPKTVFVTIGGGGKGEYLNAADTEEFAIKASGDGESAVVAEYELVATRKRKIVTSVEDAR